MRKLLHWLTQDDVARTNAAQASLRLQHRRHDRDDTDAFLVKHARSHNQPRPPGASTDAGHIPRVASRRP